MQLIGFENRLKSFNFDSVKKFNDIFDEKLSNIDIKINDIKNVNEKNNLILSQKWDEINSKYDKSNWNQNIIKDLIKEEIKKYWRYK